jgi:hypothetical protein
MDGQSHNGERIALIWRGDAKARGANETGRFASLFAALTTAGFAPESCVYDEAFEDEARAQLAGCRGALVWVNPVQDGVRRTRLDRLLREVAAGGVRVSGHPDVIDRLGVKAVLWATRELGWSGDAHLCETTASLKTEFLARVIDGPRVLKPNRGNGGAGVWKVSRASGGLLRVQAAADEARSELTLPAGAFLEARLAELTEAEGFVDQAWQPRLPEGMIRCYMSGDRLVGFGSHQVRALAPPDAGPGGPRLYSGADDPRFQHLRAQMEGTWTPGLARILEIHPDDLPVIWDADFLLGPKGPGGDDTYVLCEINASSVYPYPEEAPVEIARTLRRRFARGGLDAAAPAGHRSGLSQEHPS